MTLGYVPIPLTPVTTGRDIITDLERVNRAPVIQLVNETPVYSKPKKKRERAPRPATSRHVWPAEQIARERGQELAAEYAAGISSKKLAQRHGVTTGTMRKILTLAGAELRNDKGGWQTGRTRRPGKYAIDLNEMERLRLDKRMTNAQIAAHYDVSLGCIKRRFEELRKKRAQAGNGEVNG